MHITELKQYGLVYLASPYSKYEGGLVNAFGDICRIAAEIVSAGVPIFCPIAHSHPIAFAGSLDPLSHDLWIPADRPLMNAADVLLIVKMAGWDKSHGVRIEVETFENAKKPIFTLDVTTFEVEPLRLPTFTTKSTRTPRSGCAI